MNQIEVGGALPSLPPEIARMFQRISTPNWQSDVVDIESLLQKAVLADLFWRQIKAPFFTCAENIDSLRDLFEFADQQTVSTLLISFLIKQVMPDNLGQAEKFDRGKYLQHTLGTAVAARNISARTRIGHPDRAFAYGMVHDIGMKVLDCCLPDLLDEVCYVCSKGVCQTVAEQVVLDGLTHEDLGGWLCEKWRLPLAVKSVVKYHHRPLLATSGVDEAKMLYLSDMISAKSCGVNVGMGLPREVEETVRGHLGLTPAGLLEVERELPAQMHEAAKWID
jgi:HD-like signal output (HDOD) protein